MKSCIPQINILAKQESKTPISATHSENLKETNKQGFNSVITTKEIRTAFRISRLNFILIKACS
jgi:hypothetical protein